MRPGRGLGTAPPKARSMPKSAAAVGDEIVAEGQIDGRPEHAEVDTLVRKSSPRPTNSPVSHLECHPVGFDIELHRLKPSPPRKTILLVFDQAEQQNHAAVAEESKIVSLRCTYCFGPRRPGRRFAPRIALRRRPCARTQQCVYNVSSGAISAGRLGLVGRRLPRRRRAIWPGFGNTLTRPPPCAIAFVVAVPQLRRSRPTAHRHDIRLSESIRACPASSDGVDCGLSHRAIRRDGLRRRVARPCAPARTAVFVFSAATPPTRSLSQYGTAARPVAFRLTFRCLRRRPPRLAHKVFTGARRSAQPLRSLA